MCLEGNLKEPAKRQCTSTRHGQQWPMNGANIEFFSNYLCMHWNLTWTNYSCSLIIWEGFQTQIRWLTHLVLYISDLILVLFELSRIVVHVTRPNIYSFHHHHSVLSLVHMGNSDLLMGRMLKFFQIVYVCTKIWHCQTIHMP